MKNKSRKTLRQSILHDCVIVPITDPAEQAALDRRCREAEKVLAAGGGANSAIAKSRKIKKKAPTTPLKPTLREFELVPITDPAIQAALDHMARQAKPVVPATLREHARKNSRKAK